MERFNAACAAHPDVPRPQIMMLMHTFVGADAAEVDDAVEDLRASTATSANGSRTSGR